MTDLKNYNDIMLHFKQTLVGCNMLMKYRFKTNEKIVDENECLKHISIGYLIKCKTVGNTTSECLRNMKDFYNDVLNLKRSDEYM